MFIISYYVSVDIAVWRLSASTNKVAMLIRNDISAALFVAILLIVTNDADCRILFNQQDNENDEIIGINKRLISLVR